MSEIGNETQLQILKNLMFAPSLKYSELHKASDNHDLFNYHLKELIRKGFITKEDNHYSLTLKGRKVVSFMEEDSTLQPHFKAGIYIWLIRKNNITHEALLYKRLKHPFYGFIGTISGKMKRGEPIIETARRELKEEVNIKATEIHLIGNVRQIFRNENDEIADDGVYYTCACLSYEGEPKLKGIEGEYFWHDIDKILELENIFRFGFEQGIPHIKRFLHDPKNYTPYVQDHDLPGMKY